MSCGGERSRARSNKVLGPNIPSFRLLEKGVLVDAGATYDPDGVRTGDSYLYAQIWAGGVYLVGVMFVLWVRMTEAGWKLKAKV